MKVSKEAVGRESTFVLAVVSALRGAFHHMRGVIWQPFVLSLGVSMRSLGGLESVMDLSRLVAHPMVGGASDVYGRRRWLVAREAITFAIGVISILTRSWHLLLLIVVLLGLEGSLYPIWTALIAESVEAERLGYMYSVIGTCSMAAGLLATLSAGFIAESYGYRTVFIVSTAFAVVSFMLVLARLHETKTRMGDSIFSSREAVVSLVRTLKPPPELRGFYVAMTVDLFAFNMGYRLLYGMLVKGYGYTPQMLGVMSTLMTGSMAISQVPIGRHADRVGYARYLAISQTMAVGILGLVTYTKRYEAVLVAQALMGVSAAFWGPAEQAWIAKNVDPGERARAIGSYAAFRGLLSFPAPFIGGLLFDAYGFNAPMLLNIAIAVVDIALILVLIKD